jgi:hypothetical protein
LAGVDPRRLSSSCRSPASTPGRCRAARRVSLVVEDAAGNRATIYGPVPKTIVAPPTDRGAANGTPASDQARFTGRRHRTVTTSFRHRRLRVRGRVVRPDRKPIAGATIEVLAQLHRVGPGFRPMGSLPTSRMAASASRRRRARRALRFGSRFIRSGGPHTYAFRARAVRARLPVRARTQSPHPRHGRLSPRGGAIGARALPFRGRPIVVAVPLHHCAGAAPHTRRPRDGVRERRQPPQRVPLQPAEASSCCAILDGRALSRSALRRFARSRPPEESLFCPELTLPGRAVVSRA